MRYGLRTLACVAALTGLLSGCEDQEEAPYTPPMSVVSPTSEEARPAQDNIPVGDAQYIAYTYTYNLRLPLRQTISLYEKHRALCETAGPSHCRIETATTWEGIDGNTSAKLEFRAEPKWLANFRKQLAKDTEAANGRIADFRMESENLSREIIDTEAYVQAQTTLRDRLQNLLATRTGKLGELLEIEREFARVQRELDSAHSRLAHMRTRVEMSEVELRYGTEERDVEKLQASKRGFATGLWRKLKNSFLAMVETMAVALPWLLPLGLLVWGLRRLWAARRKANLAAKAAADAATE